MKNTKFKFLPGDEVWYIIDIEQDTFEIGHGKIFSCTTTGNMPDNRYYKIFNFHTIEFTENIELEECEVFNDPNEAMEYCLKGMKENEFVEHPF